MPGKMLDLELPEDEEMPEDEGPSLARRLLDAIADDDEAGVESALSEYLGGSTED